MFRHRKQYGILVLNCSSLIRRHGGGGGGTQSGKGYQLRSDCWRVVAKKGGLSSYHIVE